MTRESLFRDLDPPRRKRVLVVVSNPLGGIKSYLKYNLEPLLADGFIFSFLAPQGSAFDSFKNEITTWPGVSFTDIPVVNHRFSLRQSVAKLLRHEQVDLIHSQGLRAGTEVCAANLFSRKPHIITLHDVIVHGNDIPGKFKILKSIIAGWLTRYATVIIPVSYDCGANHMQHFPDWQKGPCRVEVIVNGVDVNKILAAKDSSADNDFSDIRSRLGIDPKMIMAGFFGRFMPQKGFLVLLEAMEIINNRGNSNLCLIVTKDPHGYGNKYIRIAKESMQMSSAIYFIEQLPEIAPVLAQMDVLMMPSLWEACPLLPMEAFVLGVPVIGSDAIGLREVLRGAPALTPEAGNPIKLADAIEAFVKTPAILDARSFQKTAQVKFNISKAVQELASLYKMLS